MDVGKYAIGLGYERLGLTSGPLTSIFQPPLVRWRL